MDLNLCPEALKPITHYLKIAAEHENRDIVVSYWCYIYSLQVGLKLAKDPSEKKFLLQIMDWLENCKKSHKNNEAITNETVACAQLENYALKIFLFADKNDREGNFSKSVIKCFYTAGMIYDVIQTFGELSTEAKHNSKYAKWKAAYINNCLKNGETPHAGPMPSEEDDELMQPPPSSNNQSFIGFVSPPAQPQPSTSLPQQPDNGSYVDPFLNIRAPSPPKEPEKQPGGFVPYNPNNATVVIDPSISRTSNLTPEQIIKAQKYVKWAASALNYNDIDNSIENLKNALRLLQTGQDS